MERRVWCGVRTAIVSIATVTMMGAPAAAQTTVVLDAPDTEVADTSIRGGGYAATNFDGELLITRESDDDPSFIRRALLKFDTENRIPRNARIRSATLTLTVKTANESSRRVAVYRVTQSFDEWSATWARRKASARWRSNGGDLGTRYAEATVGGRDGIKVSFDVTGLVQQVVKGSFGSRYTRVALVDVGGSGAEAETYREYYPSEASNPALRPRLTVVYGNDVAVAEPDNDDEDDQAEDDGEEPAPAPAPSPGPSSTLRVLHWNTHHGKGTDNDYDLDRIAGWIAKMNADVVSLNEVERYVGSYGNEDQPARYAALLRARTNRTWYYHYESARGGSSGGGSMILSRYPITGRSECRLSSANNAVQASIEVNGRTVNIWSTHLPSGDSSGPRVSQAGDLRTCARQFAENRIIAGDWNATQQRAEYRDMLGSYHDAWDVAADSGKAVDYPNNSRHGATHEYRIDYVFYSKGAALTLVKAQVFDTRGNDGARASDHKPLLVTFTVK